MVMAELYPGMGLNRLSLVYVLFFLNVAPKGSVIPKLGSVKFLVVSESDTFGCMGFKSLIYFSIL
jgi:hypothetical protein